MAPDQAKMIKSMGMVMVPLSIVATVSLPSGVQVYFLISSLLQWLQTKLFYIPAFRKWTGLPPLKLGGDVDTGPKAPVGSWQAPRVLNTTARPATQEGNKGGIFSSMKGALETTTEKASQMQKKSDAKAAVRKAAEYEEKRALEEKERLIARREEKAMRRH